ncbi:MAG: hypothetical protein JWR89_5204, partial [Tardiphaga sp.]|uniref:hypothetical protein n=1 Tax=Tardiphaga sp. TaxID=1926292 RepID=UPI002633BACA
GESRKEELYRRLGQTRRLAGGVNDPLTEERLRALVTDLEGQIAAVEARDADAPPTSRSNSMTGDRTELKKRLVEATRLFESAGDVEEKALLGSDVRELERLVEIAADQDPGSPRDPSRTLIRTGASRSEDV